MKITIRFYEELNNYLKTNIRKQDLFIEVEKGLPVGKLIESLGPPCSAVDLILVNGNSVGFDYILRDNDRVSVYPVFERFDIASVTRLDQAPLRNLKFICDVHLGRLAKYLRMLGFDTLYKNNYDDNILIRLSNLHNRVLLSRDKELIENKQLLRRYLIRQSEPDEQVIEVVSYFDITNQISSLLRCLECNGIVKAVSKESVKHLIDSYIYKTNNEFTNCTDCKKIFWKGSHYDAMIRQVQELMARVNEDRREVDS